MSSNVFFLHRIDVMSSTGDLKPLQPSARYFDFYFRYFIRKGTFFLIIKIHANKIMNPNIVTKIMAIDYPNFRIIFWNYWNIFFNYIKNLFLTKYAMLKSAIFQINFFIAFTANRNGHKSIAEFILNAD